MDLPTSSGFSNPDIFDAERDEILLTEEEKECNQLFGAFCNLRSCLKQKHESVCKAKQEAEKWTLEAQSWLAETRQELNVIEKQLECFDQISNQVVKMKRDLMIMHEFRDRVLQLERSIALLGKSNNDQDISIFDADFVSPYINVPLMQSPQFLDSGQTADEIQTTPTHIVENKETSDISTKKRRRQ